MSLYVSHPGAAPAKIGGYPKRHRQKAAGVEGAPVGQLRRPELRRLLAEPPRRLRG